MQESRPAYRRASHNSLGCLYSVERVVKSAVENVRDFVDTQAMEEDITLGSVSKGLFWRFSVVHPSCWSQ